MENKETDLTDEELEAIAGSMNESAGKIINASGNSSAVSHDLTMEDSALGFNQAAVDLVNERFARQVRMGLIEVLRTTPKIGIEKVQIKTFREAFSSLAAPLAISTLGWTPYEG